MCRLEFDFVFCPTPDKESDVYIVTLLFKFHCGNSELAYVLC